MKNKDSKARMQVIFGVLLFAFVMSAELYAMINFPDMYLGIVGLAAIDLVCLYVVINGLFTLREMKDARNEEQYDSVFKSEKASYLMLKKYFEEFEDKLNYLEKASKVPTEEIVNAQKGIAKVIINRSRENTEALINSNDQVMEQFTQCSDTIADITKLLTAYKEEIVSEQKKTEDANEQSIQVKMQDLVIQMKDMELRLNQAINQIQKVSYQQPVVAAAYAPQPNVTHAEVSAPAEQPKENVVPDAVEEAAHVESVMDDLDVSDNLNVDAGDLGELDIPNDLDSAEDALADLDIPEVEEVVDEPTVQPEFSEEKPIVEENVIEPEPMIEEPPVAEDKPVKEPAITIEQTPEVVEDKPVEEEKPAMSDLSDPNKTLSPDEIAALFANMSDDAPKEEEKPVEPEPIVEEKPAEEEKPPVPDLSDPNKTLSPDEIAALFANMQ